MNFFHQVYSLVKRIPPAHVASYGQVAALLGRPRAARAVGWAMHRLDSLVPAEARQYPWWRVINSRGMISTTCREHAAELQAALLSAEGVEVVRKKDGTQWVDLKNYLWQPNVGKHETLSSKS